jgi:hypothetical protein
MFSISLPSSTNAFIGDAFERAVPGRLQGQGSQNGPNKSERMDHCRHEIKNRHLRRIGEQVFPETPLHPQLFRLQYHNGYFRRHQQQDQTATKGPNIFCHDDAFMTPPQVPISFTATATDDCGDATAQITGFNCLGKKGNSKLESCDAVFSGSTITIRNSGGVGDAITWTVQATDGCGNTTTKT